jgi:hypothetical protein
MTFTEFIAKYWAYLLPILIIQITFQVIAIVDLARHPREEIRGLSKPLWVVIIIIFEVLGPVIYFIFGKKYDAGDKN